MLNGNLFVEDYGVAIDKYAADGSMTTFALGSYFFNLIAVDGDYNVYATSNQGTIEKITPAHVETTFASGIQPTGITVDQAGDVFACSGNSAAVYEYSPGGVGTLFASPGCSGSGSANLAFDSRGNLFATGTNLTGEVIEFASGGNQILYSNPSGRALNSLAFVTQNASPEPGAFVLSLAGLAALGAFLRMRPRVTSS